MEDAGGARDVANQQVLVAAEDGHAGGELGIVGKAHGVQGSSEDGSDWADWGSGVRGSPTNSFPARQWFITFISHSRVTSQPRHPTALELPSTARPGPMPSQRYGDQKLIQKSRGKFPR